jgi:tetratricopeptide (TPR) repeat protein
VLVLVFLAALAAAGATVGLTALTSDPKPAPKTICPDGPPLQVDLGVRSDPEAVALRGAQRQLAAGQRDQAAATFARFRSIEAQVGAAVAEWPESTVTDLRALAAERGGDATVRLHLGTALYCDGRRAEAEAEWRAAKLAEPDSLLAVRASDYLNPQYPVPGIPVFVPGFAYPSGLAGRPPARQLEVLRRRARADNPRAKLLYGIALQRLGRQLSAERQYAAAARLAPDDPEAQAAAAVGRFDKDRPSAAFSRLGPLSRRFPQAATVRFHLGLLLLWLGQVDEGQRQLERARRLEPGSPIAREAKRFLDRLADSTP